MSRKKGRMVVTVCDFSDRLRVLGAGRKREQGLLS